MSATARDFPSTAYSPSTPWSGPPAARRRIPKTVAVLGFLLVFGIAGCSSGSQQNNVASLSGSSSASAAAGGTGQRSDTAQQDALVKFAQCMRAHGVNMPDPQGGAVEALPGSSSSDPAAAQKTEAANTACAKDLPNGGKPTAADNERRAKFAQCMRAHGVNMPDPVNGQGMELNLSAPGAKAAINACSSLVTGGASSGG